jgi:hypothetical protein
MKQIGKLETIFEGGSLTDQLNALENALLRGGTYDLGRACERGEGCLQGTSDGCFLGVGCEAGILD